MTIASVADVEAVLLRSLTTAEAPFIDALLVLVDGLIIDETPGISWTEAVTGDAVTLYGTGSDELWLPSRPINTVTSITMNGATLDASSYRFERWGSVRRVRDWWGTDSDTIVVTYDHGLAQPPPGVRLLAARLVAGLMSNPTGAQSETTGPFSIKLGAGGQAGLELSDDDKRALRRYRRPPVAVTILARDNLAALDPAGYTW